MTTIRSGLPAFEDTSPAAQVKAALAAAAAQPHRRPDAFRFDQLSRREKIVAPLLGLYLGAAVARIHERFPVLAVPRLLFTMMGVMLATLVLTVPVSAWVRIWRASAQLRLVAVITGCAIITVPLGIWMAGSLDFLINRFPLTLAVFVACLLLMRDRRTMRWVITFYVLIVAVVAGRNLYAWTHHDLSDTIMTAEQQQQYVDTGIVDPGQMRQAFGSLDPNDIAAVMATTFPLALWLSVGSFRRRMVWLPIAGLLLMAVIPTASRGGLLGLGGAAIALAFFGAKGGRRVFLIGTLLAGGAAFLVLAGSQLNRMESLGANDYNFTTGEGRIAIWKRGIVWMIRRPWGYGLNNFPTYFGWLNGDERAAHNSLIQYGVELGVIGLAAYLILCVTLVRSLLTIRRNAMLRGPEGVDTVSMIGHVLAMLFACWVTGFFLSNAYYPLTYMALGIGSAVVLSAHGASTQLLPSTDPQPAQPVRRRREFKGFAPSR